jgi:hypothetical protein
VVNLGSYQASSSISNRGMDGHTERGYTQAALRLRDIVTVTCGSTSGLVRGIPVSVYGYR